MRFLYDRSLRCGDSGCRTRVGRHVHRATAADRRGDAAPHRRRQYSRRGDCRRPPRQGGSLQGARLNGCRGRASHVAGCDLHHDVVHQADSRCRGDDDDRGGFDSPERSRVEVHSGIRRHAGGRAEGSGGRGHQPVSRRPPESAGAQASSRRNAHHDQAPAHAYVRLGQRRPGNGPGAT